MDVVKKIKNLISSWYLRYLLATELYMVEPWEKVVFHVFCGIIFWVFWYFNYNFVIDTVASLRSGSTPYTEEIM